MGSTKSDIALVADSSPPRTAASATEILAAALSELLREAKRHTALLEVLVKGPAGVSPPSPAGTPAAEPRKSAAARAAVVVPASPKANRGTLNGSTGGGSPRFSVEELRARARAHNHLLDIDSPKSRAMLALLRDDGNVPDHFPADMDGFRALTSQQLHGLLRAYGLPDSNATLSSQRAAFGRFIGLHKYCRG